MAKSHKLFHIILGLFLCLSAVSLIFYWQYAHTFKDEVMAEEIAQLHNIFERIHETCHITGFEHKKNYIDFLNVGSFTGSRVGPMNLMYPEKWEGPYVQDNPTMQEQFYQIVQTEQGYFILPGNGVQLSNGKVIGKDIVITAESNVLTMMQDDTLLRYQNKPLARQLDFLEFSPLPKVDALVESIDAG